MHSIHRQPPAADPASAAPSLRDVVARMGAEVAAPLTAALERVVTLASSGRIDRYGLQALRNEIDGARRVGLRGQQIARLAAGELRQALERLDLPTCLRNVLNGQAVHTNGLAIACPPPPARAEVLADASLLHAVLDAAAEWSASLARANVEWRIDVQPWPVRARVTCRFAHLPADHSLPPPAVAHDQVARHHEPRLDTLDWLLLTYAAHITGVALSRQDSSSHTQLTLEFLNTVNGTLEGAAAVDLVAATDGGPQSLAGCQVLVLAARRHTRQLLRDVSRGQDLQIDYVSSVDAATQSCQDGLPQLLIHEQDFEGPALSALLADLARHGASVGRIVILPTGQDCEIAGAHAGQASQLGFDAVRHMLLPLMVLAVGRASAD